MPTLPLPLGGAALHGGDLPVSDGSDVLAEFADTHRRPDTAAVRDAFVDSFSRAHVSYQDESAALLAQLDPRTTSGDALLQLAVEHGVTPGVGEDPEVLRARIFASQDVVTPNAIVNAVNALLAPYTTVQCQLVELEMDGIFIDDGTAAGSAFIVTLGTINNPHYPDRYYADDTVENGGFSLSNNQPGAGLLSQGNLRSFHLRLPEIAASDDDFSFCIDADFTDIMAIFDGTQTDSADTTLTSSNNFIFNSTQTSDEVYAVIVATVESLKGQGISWSAIVDPYLT